MSYHVDNNYSANKSFENQGFYPSKTGSANNKGGFGRYIQHKSLNDRKTVKAESARKTTFSYGKNDNSKKFFEGKKVVKSDANQKNKDLNGKICGARTSKEILRICDESKNDFNEVNVATALNRLAKSKDFIVSRLDQQNQKIFGDLKAEAYASASQFGPQALSNILWSFTVTRVFSIDLIKALVEQASELIEKDPRALNEQGLSQLLQARLAFQKESFGDQIRFGDKLERALDQAKDELVHTNYASSQLHKEAAATLKKLVNFEEEKFVDFISCDILLEQDRTVFEINGPWHYLHKSNKLDGATLLKLRLLQKQGYSIIVIPYWEWDQLDTEEDEKYYLKARLGQIVSSKTPVTSLSLEEGIVEL